MKAVFTLTSAESRRLIAKAVVAMPEFKAAWEDAYVILAGGTTNAYIAGKGVDVGADIFRRGLCLPSDIKMTAEEQDAVIQIIRSCFD